MLSVKTWNNTQFINVFESWNPQKEKPPAARSATAAIKMEVDWLQFKCIVCYFKFVRNFVENLGESNLER